MDALEKVGDHVPFTLTTGQQHACHAVPRTHIWKDVLGQVITVPLRDSVVVVMGECLLRLLSGGGATHIVRAQGRLLLFHKAFTLAPCRVIRTRPIRSIAAACLLLAGADSSGPDAGCLVRVMTGGIVALAHRAPHVAAPLASSHGPPRSPIIPRKSSG